MKKNRFLLPFSLLLSVLCLTACVDKDFSLDNISTEISVGGETTTLPLGYIEKKSLGEIIEADDMEGLRIDPETGEYSLSFEGEEEQIAIEGIDSHFSIPEIMGHFETDYPSFDLIGEAYELSESFEVSPLMSGVAFPSGSVSVPAGISVSGEVDDTMLHAMHYEVPAEIRNITKVWFKASESGAPGARISARFALNDLAPINGGGVLNLELKAPQGYELYDKDGSLLDNSTFSVDNYALQAGENEVEFWVYIASVENNNPITSSGEIDIPVELEYHLSFDLTTKSSTLTLNQKPELHIDATLEYEDAAIELNEVELMDHVVAMDGSINIAGLPEEVKSINRIELKGASPISLVAKDFDWLDDETAHLVGVEVQLPSYLYLHEQTPSGYDEATHTLTAHLDDLRHGVALYLDAIDFGEGGNVVPVDGELVINFAPDVCARISEGAQTTLSHLVHEGKLSLSVGIEQTEIDINSVTGLIGFTYEESVAIEIGGLDDEELDVTINSPGLSPVIVVDFLNPLTLDSKISISLQPKADGVVNEQNTVRVNEVVIPAATIEQGEVVSRRVSLVLAEESHRDDYTAEEYLFVACDLVKLFEGSLPDEVLCNLTFATDSSKLSTLYAAEQYVASYSYCVDVPFAFSNDLDLSYEELVDGLDDTFSDLSEQDIRVGDVALIAEVGTTIPLNFSLEAELVDAEGNPTEAQLHIPTTGATLRGSEDGVKESLSQLRLELDLGKEGRVANLAEVAAVRLALRATSSSDELAKLRADQYIYLKLKIELKGGITIDLDTLLNDEE